MKRYNKFFEEDGQCDCSKCDKKEECDKKKKESMMESKMICESCKLPEVEVEEDCPYKPLSNGGCADKENNKPLVKQCQDGFQWSDGKGGCYKVGDVKAKSNSGK